MKISDDLELTSPNAMLAQLISSKGGKISLSLDQVTGTGLIEVMSDIELAHESGNFRGWTMTTEELVRLAFCLGVFAYKQR